MFAKAVQCKLSQWEQKTYLQLIDDIFEDSSVISRMASAGLTVRILGSDIKKLRDRLRNPKFRTPVCVQHFYLFVVVSDSNGSNGHPTLVRDYRESPEHGFVPDDLDLTELHARFDTSIAEQIAEFSRWVLCAPYLAGTMPNHLPGWIPLLNTLPHVHVRTYISTYNDCNGRILHMDRNLTKQLFGLEANRNLLLNLSSLETEFLKFDRSGESTGQLYSNFVIGLLHNLLEEPQRQKNMDFIITHTLHSSSCCITVKLQ